MSISECAQTEVVCCEPDTSVPAVAALMRKHHVGDVVVVDNLESRVPVGIVTDRDIVIDLLALGIDPDTFTAGDLMSSPALTVSQEAGYADTLRLMRSHTLRRVLVVSAAGALVGIVTADDLVNQLACELSLLADAIAGQPTRERRERK